MNYPQVGQKWVGRSKLPVIIHESTDPLECKVYYRYINVPDDRLLAKVFWLPFKIFVSGFDRVMP